MDAVSISPTRAVPLMVGAPVAAECGPIETETTLSPMSLTAMTRTVYSTPSVSPVMVWVVPVTVASETSSAVSQLSAASFHCTL